MKTCDESIIFALGLDRGCAAVPGFSPEIGRPARFGDRKSGKSTARHAQHVTIRSAPRSHPIKHTHRKYRFLSGSICPHGYFPAGLPSQSFRQPDFLKIPLLNAWSVVTREIQNSNKSRSNIFLYSYIVTKLLLIVL